MDMSSVPLDVPQAFYHLPLHPLSAAGSAFPMGNWSISEKLQWGSVLALSCSVSSALPSQPELWGASLFGVLLIWTTSSSATQALNTLLQLAALSALPFK